MLDLETAKERAARGAALLDERIEDEWRNLIDLSQLDMSYGGLCILGQVFDAYDAGIGALFGYDLAIGDEHIKSALHGFLAMDNEDYVVLQRAWVSILEAEPCTP